MEENEGECTTKAEEKKVQRKFLAVGDACVSIF